MIDLKLGQMILTDKSIDLKDTLVLKVFLLWINSRMTHKTEVVDRPSIYVSVANDLLEQWGGPGENTT